MVYFVCQGCNETLKKNQVDKHVNRCRQGCPAVSCVDCSATFYGDDFNEHTTCVSEEEKYQKSLYKPGKVKIGPQELWMELIGEACVSDIAPSNLRSSLTRIKDLANVPRQRTKFFKFLKNSVKIFDEVISNQIWEYIDTFRTIKSNQNLPTSVSSNEASGQNVKKIGVDNDENGDKAKLKKRKKTSDDHTSVALTVADNGDGAKLEKKRRKKDSTERDGNASVVSELRSNWKDEKYEEVSKKKKKKKVVVAADDN